MEPVLAIFGLGPQELILIGVIGLVFFGTRLPKLARSLGQSVNEFKHGLKESTKGGGADEETEGK